MSYPFPECGNHMLVPCLLCSLQLLVMSADDDAVFLHGLLEGIASIEAEAYALLGTLGGGAVTKVTLLSHILCHIILHTV